MRQETFRKYVTLILKRKGGSGDETTLIGVCAHVEVHTVQFSLHMQSGSSQRSLGDSIKFFFSFPLWEKASASRQGQRMKTLFFRKNEGKRRHAKQEIGEKERKNDGIERRRVKKEACEQRK